MSRAVDMLASSIDEICCSERLATVPDFFDELLSAYKISLT